MHSHLKIAICGAPNSGKSVFSHVLASLLPRNRFTLIEGAPDGIGVNGGLYQLPTSVAKRLRRKGSFVPKYVDWIVRSVRQSTASITLVDIGGKISPENMQIMQSCSHVIVLGRTRRQILSWIHFAQTHHLTVLAILHTLLQGEDTLYSESIPIRGVVTGLKRDQPPFNSMVIQRIANLLLTLSTTDDPRLDGSMLADINLSKLAEKLDLPINPGGIDRRWTPESLSELLQNIDNQCHNNKQILLWGNASSGLPYHTVAANLLNQRIRYYDPKINPGYVPLADVDMGINGDDLLEWERKDRSGYTHIHFRLKEGVFDVFDLPMLKPPFIDTKKGLILTGRGMWWLTGTILRCYARYKLPWIAVLNTAEISEWYKQHPQKNDSKLYGVAVVIMTNSPTIQLGTTMVFPLAS
ncbi:hypothetical protein HGA91_02085 [candidate division WWE3 bacterium]|nr:hypothetical protein [candidate division WWE3 bacterium]